MLSLTFFSFFHASLTNSQPVMSGCRSALNFSSLPYPRLAKNDSGATTVTPQLLRYGDLVTIDLRDKDGVSHWMSIDKKAPCYLYAPVAFFSDGDEAAIRFILVNPYNPTTFGGVIYDGDPCYLIVASEFNAYFETNKEASKCQVGDPDDRGSPCGWWYMAAVQTPCNFGIPDIAAPSLINGNNNDPKWSDIAKGIPIWYIRKKTDWFKEDARNRVNPLIDDERGIHPIFYDEDIAIATPRFKDGDAYLRYEESYCAIQKGEWITVPSTLIGREKGKFDPDFAWGRIFNANGVRPGAWGPRTPCTGAATTLQCDACRQGGGGYFLCPNGCSPLCDPLNSCDCVCPASCDGSGPAGCGVWKCANPEDCYTKTALAPEGIRCKSGCAAVAGALCQVTCPKTCTIPDKSPACVCADCTPDIKPFVCSINGKPPTCSLEPGSNGRCVCVCPQPDKEPDRVCETYTCPGATCGDPREPFKCKDGSASTCDTKTCTCSCPSSAKPADDAATPSKLTPLQLALIIGGAVLGFVLLLVALTLIARSTSSSAATSAAASASAAAAVPSSSSSSSGGGD
jgi:hypothetical protein